MHDRSLKIVRLSSVRTKDFLSEKNKVPGRLKQKRSQRDDTH